MKEFVDGNSNRREIEEEGEVILPVDFQCWGEGGGIEYCDKGIKYGDEG